ncbi:MAG: hypothetical protein KAS15_03065 [Nanoarchaeota archaeon]|nr:hypothetical protein [Nanoarchaeota archaeon]
MILSSKKGVITSPIGFGFVIGIIAGLILGILLTYMIMSGNWKIPFIGG